MEEKKKELNKEHQRWEQEKVKHRDEDRRNLVKQTGGAFRSRDIREKKKRSGGDREEGRSDMKNMEEGRERRGDLN